MIEHRAGDIFAQGDLTHLVHQCNLFHTFGSGIAAEIKRRFPWTYGLDKRGKYGDKGRLGTYDISNGPRLAQPRRPYIVNMYSQDGIGARDRQTNYAAMGAALLSLERELSHEESISGEETVLGVPHGIGCGLGGGDWAVVLPLLESAFGKSPVKVVICKK